MTFDFTDNDPEKNVSHAVHKASGVRTEFECVKRVFEFDFDVLPHKEAKAVTDVAKTTTAPICPLEGPALWP